MRLEPPMLGAFGETREPQFGAPWAGTVTDTGVSPEGVITGSASIDVTPGGTGAGARGGVQKLMPGWNTMGGWKPLLIALGIAAAAGLAYLGYRKYGHRLFGAGRKKKGRRRGRKRG